MHAMMQRDRTTCEQLPGAEFEVTSIKYIDSTAVNRNMWMYNTMNDLKIDSVHFIKTKVTIVDDVGKVKAYYYWNGTYDGSPFFDSTSFVDTWIRRNGGWQVVSRVITDAD
jgi:hypothetical protein